jgi:hypothetical protein
MIRGHYRQAKQSEVAKKNMLLRTQILAPIIIMRFTVAYVRVRVHTYVRHMYIDCTVLSRVLIRAACVEKRRPN